MDSKHRNYGLDIARCLAILLVLCMHAFQTIFAPGIPYIWYLAFAGVELFFALSGFLIGKILFDLFMLHNGRLPWSDLKNFLLRRWLRTLPLYYAVLILLLLLHAGGTGNIPYEWKYFIFLNNFTANPPPFFGESWSLAIEEWFYLLYATLLFISTALVFRTPDGFIRKISTRNLFALLLLIFIWLTWLIKLAAVMLNIQHEFFTIVIYRLDAIAYGIAGYWIFDRFRLAEKEMSVVLAGALIVILSGMIVRFSFPDNSLRGVTYYLVAGTGYAGFVVALASLSFKKKYRIVSHISKISYSLYLTHLSLILLPMIKYFKPATLEQRLGFLFAYLLITYLVSLFSYHVVEKNFNAIRNRLFQIPRAV